MAKGCATSFCAIKSVRAMCPHHMCKAHCVISGGCSTHGFPSAQSESAPPVSATCLTSTESDVLNDFLLDTDPAGGPDPLSHLPVPAIGLDGTAHEALAAEAPPSVSQPPLPLLGSAATKILASHPSSSQSAHQTLDPCLSTQLNDTWLTMHTEHEILKTEHQRRMEMKRTHEQCLKGRFIVNYWDESNADPISVTGYEKSTVCSLSDHHDLLRALSPNLGDVEYYDTKLRRWILDNWDRPLVGSWAIHSTF
ncbi:uncharacterized protein F5147DRAFT_776095 [Suillus discolor]|uniref:Uncharacterized protein n=1 Tax=Suillus discolor TaxID=1912936 RepID=A0A9P7JRF7_9AGAM|nr:uncharacterized protein F5147DRAFT_776095 [Suillus discolor]KAG2103104.1 hypothetical protein F5147DRAFT_776095 [Suillus discolor]